MAEVVLKNISKVFPGGVTAVDSINLRAADGEFLVLSGPSGCGKTTTLRMIAGLDLPTGGTIQIGGQIVDNTPPHQRDVAMVFQSYPLYPHMTVRANLAFALKVRKVPRREIDRRLCQAAADLDIEELLTRRPAELSGGQRQRVALGKAIIRRPKVFLLDEPLSNLDAALRQAVRDLLKQLHRKLQTTTIYVTHDQAEAENLAQRIVTMKNGELQRS